MTYSLAPRGRRPVLWQAAALVSLAVLASCASMQEQPESTPADSAVADIVKATEQVTESRVNWRETRQARVEALLAEADEALADNRLTLPEHDNAYDRYSAVLLLDRDSQRAKAGLESILLSYVDLIRSALRSNQISRARQLLNQAQEYYDDNLLLQEMQTAVAQAEAQSRRRMKALSEQDMAGTEFDLPPQELSRKSEKVIEFLTKIAQRVRETDESVLIQARSDAEGRWIYQQMRDAVPDYRIRGDIRVTQQPGVILQPPL